MKNLFFLSAYIFICCLACTRQEEPEDQLPKLFNAELSDGSIYLQIADSLLEREFLIVSRITQAPTNFDPYVAGGSKRAERMVYWEKQGGYLLLRARSTNNISTEDDPIHIAVKNNSLDPVLERFKIRNNLLGGGQLKIDVTSMFTNHRTLLSGWGIRLAKKYDKDDLDESSSWVESVRAFPENVEIRQSMTYFTGRTPMKDGTGKVTLLMNHSFIVLPQNPMPVREYNPKMGWFTVDKEEYASGIAEVKPRKFIERWQLIPKDIEAYKCGDLVEPVQPIIFYLDPATPLKWRPYFKKGVEAWNTCFETAGFKNAIIAKDPPDPECDPDFSPEDVRYSVIRYVANTTRNAFGPSVVDPRSGQILESDIMWHHNVMDWLRNRYLIETGATNPKANQLFLADEVMGELISLVIMHEVGHALGLSHNMKASAAYPTDSLRSYHFTARYGITPTLMDYARFNYIAQPGDGPVEYIANLGPYDHYAINWGYRYLPEPDMATEDISSISEQFSYQFSDEDIEFDPTTQTEGLGNDNIKASQYGIGNLKLVMDSIIVWASVANARPDHLSNLHQDLLLMWYRYQRHVLMNIGGVQEQQKLPEEDGAIYSYTEKAVQQKALTYLLQQAFAEQQWLFPQTLTSRIYPEDGFDIVIGRQKKLLSELVHPKRLLRMIDNEILSGSSAYSISELFDGLNKGFWNSGPMKDPLDHTSRELQNYYVRLLLTLYQAPKIEGLPVWRDSEIVPASLAALTWIQQRLQERTKIGTSIYDSNYWHYKGLLAKMQQTITNQYKLPSDDIAIHFSVADRREQGCYY